MNNNTPTQNKFQSDSLQSRRSLLESTKLSRLPDRKPFTMPNLSNNPLSAARCVNCGGRLDPDDAVQQSVKVCRKCLAQYARIDAAIEESSKRKIKETLERMAGGAQ